MDKEERFVPFLDEVDSELVLHLEDIKEYLLKNNEEYKRLKEEAYSIIDSSENIQQIVCNDKIKNVLSIEESEQLAKLITIYNEMQIILYKEIYFNGGANAYDYFKKIGILK